MKLNPGAKLSAWAIVSRLSAVPDRIHAGHRSIAARGYDEDGQCAVPASNAHFAAVTGV